MRPATGVLTSVLICVLLAGCLDSIVSPPASDGGGKKRPVIPPPYAGADGPGDGLDPLRWAVDPVTEEARYLGREGAGGTLHREASRFEPHRTGHCGGAPADPRWANAIGTANGIQVKSSVVVDVELDYGELGVRQSGPGATSDDRRLIHVRVPDPTGQYDHIVTAVIVALEGESVVNASALESSQRMVAEIVDLSVLDGTVRADLLRAEGSTRATPRHAEWSTNGTVTAGVAVAGGHNVSIHPWFHVDLSDVFGPGSYVSFFEAWGHVHTPVKPVDGFAADVEITMVRVVLADVNPVTPTAERVDIAVARVWSHSDFPEDPGCRVTQGLEGHAYNLHVTHPLPAQPVTLGLVDLPSLGGNESQHLAHVDVGANTVGAAKTRVWGDVPRDRSWARGMAEAADVCLLEGASGACVVEASLVRVTTLAVVAHDGAKRTEAETVIADLRVFGQEVCPVLGADGLCRPAPDTVLEFPGLRIVLNAQSEVSVQLPECQTGIRVRGIDVHVLSDQARVIVSESQSGAFYCPALLQ